MQDEICFHDFLTGMRTGKKVTLEQLGYGLCSADMLSRIETGERLPDKLMRDRLMERLGFENDGFEDFLQPDEYGLWQTRERLLRAVEAKEIAETERLLRLLEQADTKENVILRQFCLDFCSPWYFGCPGTTEVHPVCKTLQTGLPTHYT